MANIGGLNPGQSFDSLSQKFNGADAGTEIWGYCTMENNSSTNKVGRITVSTNFDGGNLNVAVGSSYGATDGASGTVRRGSSFSCYVSYLERSNYIVITVPQEIREEFTVEISFSALTGREATFEVEQGLVYNGSLQYGIINLSNCSVASGTRTGTDPGTYNCTLQANNSVKYSDCYYFDDGGVAQSLKSAVWTISKGLPNWNMTPAETNIKIGETGRVIISGTFTGLDTVQQSSPDGGEVSFLGLNGNIYSFKGTKAGTVAVIIYSKENKYYESDNRVFRVVVSKNKEDQHWEFVGSVDIELDNTVILKPLTGTLYGKVVFGYPIGDEKYFTNISFNSTKQELTISANATYSGNTTLTIMAQGDATHGYKEQDIIVNIIKHKQAWELRPSEISIPVGGSSTIKIAGDIPLGGILTPTYSSQYIDVVSHTVAGTNPYYTITGKQAVSRTVLTISNTEVPTYDDLSKYAYITVGNKKEQTWETAYGTEITIEPYGNYYISIFGAVYGGIDYSTESSIINISDKSENGCKITSNGTSGTAIVKIYSPGNEEYNEKTINVTITVSKKLQWIPINPHIYKNGKWAEMFPKIYKNGKWLSGTIWKYVSEGDIYGK